MSGLIADAKTLIDKARVETQVRLDVSLLKTGALWESLAREDRYSKGADVEWGALLPSLGFCRANVFFFLFAIAHLVGTLSLVVTLSL